MAKVRKFKDGLKLSIRGKIVGLLLHDMDLMIKIAMAIKREVDDARSIRDASVTPLSGPTRFANPNQFMDARLILFIYFSFGFIFVKVS